MVWRSQTGGIKGWQVSTWVCAYGKCLLWNPSVAFGASSLWQGSLFVPGIVSLCDTGLFQTFNRQRGKDTPPTPTNPNGGKGRNPPPRAKAKGQSRMVPPGGFSRGEQFERERVVPPLSRLLCLLSCRSKKVRPRWQAPGVPPVSISPAGVPPVSISHGSLLRFVTSLTRPVSAACRRTYYLFLLPYSLNSPGIVTAVEVGAPITFIKYQPPSKPLAYRPLAPSVTCGDSSLPEGAIGFCLFT